MTTEFTGKDWPIEPVNEQREALKNGEYHVLVCGEIFDVHNIYQIITTLSYLRKFGRPFNSLYRLVRHRFTTHSSTIRYEVPFDHKIFVVSEHRVKLLRLLLAQCGDSTLYELAHREDGKLIVERNFPECQEGLNAGIEAALRANGWTEPTGKPFFNNIEAWEERKKLGKKAPLLSVNRLFNELSHLWKGDNGQSKDTRSRG